MNHAYGITRPRPLTEKERSFTRWLIEHGGAPEEERVRYLAQLERATVIRKCSCGCASIDFAIDDREPPREEGLSPFGDFFAADQSFGVFVFQKAGVLAGVEIYSLADVDTPAEFPDTKDLIPAEWTEGPTSPPGQPR